MENTIEVDDGNDSPKTPHWGRSNLWLSIFVTAAFSAWWIGIRFHTWADRTFLNNIAMTVLAVSWCWLAASGLMRVLPLMFAPLEYWNSSAGVAVRKTITATRKQTTRTAIIELAPTKSPRVDLGQWLPFRSDRLITTVIAKETNP